MREQPGTRNGTTARLQQQLPDVRGFIGSAADVGDRSAAHLDSSSSLLVACVKQRCRMHGVTAALAWLEEEIAALGIFLDPVKGARADALDVEGAMREAPGSPLVAYAANLKHDVGTDAMLEIISAELAQARSAVVRLMMEATEQAHHADLD